MNLYLIGYRGSGKTTLGKRLADRLGLEFVDTDELIQQWEDASIREIFERVGEKGFRELEHTTLLTILMHTKESSSVISLGGGAVLDGRNRTAIADSGKSVWLTADAGTIWQRLSGDDRSDQRPPLTDLDPQQEIVKLLEQRREIYEACADYTIDTGSTPPDEAVEQIARWWESVDK